VYIFHKIKHKTLCISPIDYSLNFVYNYSINQNKQEGKTMTKTNIMKRAWELYREANCSTRYEFGLALSAAWAEQKSQASWAALQAHVKAQEDKYPNAFKAKYPKGILEKAPGDYRSYSWHVQFTQGGKKYTYNGGIVTVFEKLGIKVA